MINECTLADISDNKWVDSIRNQIHSVDDSNDKKDQLTLTI